MGPLPRLEEVGRILSWCSAFCEKGLLSAGCWWLMTVILDTEEAEIRRIMARSQPRQINLRDPILKIPNTKRASGVAQGVGPEFKP
jgi:hypothetical protein